EDASVTLFRLHPGVDRAAFEAAVGATGADGDFVAALNAALDLVDVVLEVGARAGVPASAGAVLAPGEYALAYQSLSEEGPAAATTYSYVTVVPGDGDAPPDVVGTVHADEFLFALPAGLAAGEQTWAVTNVGGQLHNMVLFRLDAGATAADLRAWLLGGGGPPPATEAGVVGLFGPGETVYQTLDLAPGAYVAACFVPHHGPGGDGAPHFQHGLLQPFPVGDGGGPGEASSRAGGGAGRGVNASFAPASLACPRRRLRSERGTTGGSDEAENDADDAGGSRLGRGRGPSRAARDHGARGRRLALRGHGRVRRGVGRHGRGRRRHAAAPARGHGRGRARGGYGRRERRPPHRDRLRRGRRGPLRGRRPPHGGPPRRVRGRRGAGARALRRGVRGVAGGGGAGVGRLRVLRRRRRS